MQGDFKEQKVRGRLERFRAKWNPVRVKKTRQIKNPEPRSDFIGTEMALGSRAFAALLMSTALGSITVVMPDAAQAQASQSGHATQRTFAIQPQPLPSALTVFGQQTGLQVSVDAAAVRSLTSPGATGTMTPAAALTRLLAGTGLSYRFTGASTVVIGSPGAQTTGGAAPAGAIALDTIDVEGASSSDPGRTEGTGSYTPSVTATATNFQLTPRETPQSITVVTRQQIEDFSLNSITDVMNQTPGITTMTYENNRVEFYSRGFAVRNIQQDGMPGYYDSMYPAGQSLSDMAMYDRAEVLKGANGLLTVSGDPGGTINLIRKKPTRAFQGYTTLGGGSWDDYRGELDLGGALNESGTVRGRFVTAHQENGSYRHYYHNKSMLFYGILEADLTPDTLLTVGADYQKNTPRGTEGAIPLFDSLGNFNRMPVPFNPAARWSRRDQEAYNIFTTLEHRFDNDWRIKAQFRHQVSSHDTALGNIGWGNPNPVDGSGVGLWIGNYVGGTNNDNLDVHATGPVELFDRKHDVMIGGIISRRHNQNVETGPDAAYDWNVANFYRWNGNIPEPNWQNFSWRENTWEITDDRAAYAAVRLNPHDRVNAPPAKAGGFGLRLEAGFDRPFGSIVRRP